MMQQQQQHHGSPSAAQHRDVRRQRDLVPTEWQLLLRSWREEVEPGGQEGVDSPQQSAGEARSEDAEVRLCGVQDDRAVLDEGPLEGKVRLD
jgi:hypothetical protein